MGYIIYNIIYIYIFNIYVWIYILYYSMTKDASPKFRREKKDKVIAKKLRFLLVLVDFLI